MLLLGHALLYIHSWSPIGSSDLSRSVVYGMHVQQKCIRTSSVGCEQLLDELRGEEWKRNI
jgi:hypothetical protein